MGRRKKNGVETDSIILTREDIIKFDDIEMEVMTIPEWKGGKIGVVVMNCGERQRFQLEMGRPDDTVPINLMENLVARTVVNPETKEKLFTLKDIEALSRKSSQVVGRIFAVSARINGLTIEASEDLKKT